MSLYTDSKCNYSLPFQSISGGAVVTWGACRAFGLKAGRVALDD